MVDKEFVMAQMDESAEVARNEFIKTVANGSAKDVAKWVTKHYKTAGYTRLCAILKEFAK